MNWPTVGVDPCMRLAYRRPGKRLDPLFALIARARHRSFGDAYRCGLLHEHAGACVWFTPGGYLPPTLITPLALFDAGWTSGKPWLLRCPLCGDGLRSVYKERTLVVYGDAEDAERDEVRWEVRPCGCEGRELVAAVQAG